LPFGDLSFAEPPDCFSVPIRDYASTEGGDEFLDAQFTGGSVPDAAMQAAARADDLLEIARVLLDSGAREHAVCTIPATRRRPVRRMAGQATPACRPTSRRATVTGARVRRPGACAAGRTAGASGRRDCALAHFCGSALR
jgi:hypothetical protein